MVHTGQHYDANMSDVFFAELGIPRPDHALEIGSGPHGAQTGAMLAAVEQVLQSEEPDLVLVYGDTNSTLAGALAAAKLHVPVAHVEAGLRSFNRRMPEEINRVLTDQLSELLFTPSPAARDNLAAEGIARGVHVVGDVMVDAVLQHRTRSERMSRVLDELGLQPRSYYAATMHRAENTDDPDRLARLVDCLGRLDRPVVLALHPRTRKQLDAFGIRPGAGLRLVRPLGYLDMLKFQGSAALVLTDSGGVQKEAYLLGVPCVTLRSETEWVETVETGWNVLVDADPDRIRRAVGDLTRPPALRPMIYGDGTASQLIVDHLSHWAGGS